MKPKLPNFTKPILHQSRCTLACLMRYWPLRNSRKNTEIAARYTFFTFNSKCFVPIFIIWKLTDFCLLQDILCCDCDKKGKAPFHWLYHKCKSCGSYNTKVIKVDTDSHCSTSNQWAHLGLSRFLFDLHTLHWKYPFNPRIDGCTTLIPKQKKLFIIRQNDRWTLMLLMDFKCTSM